MINTWPDYPYGCLVYGVNTKEVMYNCGTPGNEGPAVASAPVCVKGAQEAATATCSTEETTDAPTNAPAKQCSGSCYSAKGVLDASKQCDKSKCEGCCECTGEC